LHARPSKQKRQPQSSVRKREPGRHDANHATFDSVQSDCLSQDIRIRRKTAAPEFVAKQNNTWRTGLLFLGVVRQARRAGKRAKARLVGDQEQSLWLDKRQWAQEHPAYYSENRGVGSDAERHRQNSQCRKPRGLAQAAEGVTEVLADRLNNHDHIYFVRLFFCQGPIAEAPSCIESSCFLSHACIEVVTDTRVNVKLQFLIEIPAQILTAQQVRESIPPAHIGIPLNEMKHAGHGFGQLCPVLLFLSQVLASG
jgi:hypothetical protein